MIVAAHQTMLAPQGAPLPYDAEVEYLASDGNAYIDTGVVPLIPDDLTYTARILWPNVSVRKIMGRQGGFYFGVVNGKLQPGLGGTGTVNAALAAGQPYDIAVRFLPTKEHDFSDFRYWAVAGIGDGSAQEQFQHDPSASSPIWIFAANNATALRGASSVYSFQIIRSGTTIRDYQPVRVGSGSSAVGYLYDRVSGTLFGNAGTGAFTIGPDK